MSNAVITTSPAMKYLLVEIYERNGDKQYTAKCLAQCSTEQNNDLVADAITLNWHKDNLDGIPSTATSFGLMAGQLL